MSVATGNVFKDKGWDLDPENEKTASFKKTYEDRLKKHKIELKILENNELYEPGMPVFPINISSFGAGSKLFIEDFIKPIVLQDGNVLRDGKAILRGK